jgi:hypothetical protein
MVGNYVRGSYGKGREGGKWKEGSVDRRNYFSTTRALPRCSINYELRMLSSVQVENREISPGEEGITSYSGGRALWLGLGGLGSM